MHVPMITFYIINNMNLQQNALIVIVVDIGQIKYKKKCLTRFFGTFPLFHVLNGYSGALAWHNLWITMHAIEVRMTLCECLPMVLHLKR